MAPSRVSAMKMRNLLFGVILGLLAVVHSTPVNTVTQNPLEAEDDFFREAMTDGFLIEHSLPLLTTESLPKKQTDDSSSVSSTTQIPQSGFTTSPVANETQTEESNVPDGSGEESLQNEVEHYTTTTQSVTQSTTSTVLWDTDSDSSTTQIPESGVTTSPVAKETQTEESNIPDGSGDEGTQIPQFWFSLAVNEGSGDVSITPTTQLSVSHGQSSTPSLFEIDTEGSSSASSSTQIPLSDFTSSFMLTKAQSTEKIKPQDYPGLLRAVNTGEVSNEPEKQNTAHGTPGWIIIVGFIVGVAALVMLCVAIATRDKWNGPSHASQVETNTNSTNQQRALELETFLHKDTPRENGKASDYTVIPLDELSESYSSH